MNRRNSYRMARDLKHADCPVYGEPLAVDALIQSRPMSALVVDGDEAGMIVAGEVDGFATQQVAGVGRVVREGRDGC